MPPTTDDPRPLEHIVDVLIERRTDLFTVPELELLDDVLDPEIASPMRDEVKWALSRRDGEEAG